MCTNSTEQFGFFYTNLKDTIQFPNKESKEVTVILESGWHEKVTETIWNVCYQNSFPRELRRYHPGELIGYRNCTNEMSA